MLLHQVYRIGPQSTALGAKFQFRQVELSAWLLISHTDPPSDGTSNYAASLVCQPARERGTM
jgi:hypothetical protein